MGSKGAVFATEANPDPVHVPCVKVKNVVDTTGAGDAFVGAFAYFFFCHPSKPDLSECILRACAVASISVQKPGTQVSFPTRAEVPKSLLD